MDDREGKEESSLPPDYVSLAQLQERWLKKQQEKKLKEKPEEEKKIDGYGKTGRGSLRGRKVEKDCRETGAVEERGKGKEIVIDGFENEEENKKKHMKSRRRIRGFGKMKSAGDEGKGKEVEKEKVSIEIKELNGGDGTEGVEIVDSEFKGFKEIAGVPIVKVSARYEVKGKIADVKRTEIRGGFRRNCDNRGSIYKRNKEDGGRLNELKQSEGTLAFVKKAEDGKGYGKKCRESGRNGEYRERYRLKESRDDVLEGNEVEQELENEVEDEILEVFSEKCGLSGRDSNRVGGQSNNGSNKTKGDGVEGGGLIDDTVALEKKVEHEVLGVESVKNGEKGGVGSGYRRYENWRGNFRDGRKYTSSRRYVDHRKMKQRESGKMWVKKEEKSRADAAEIGSSGTSVYQE